MAHRSQRQLCLPEPTSWGGARVGAGRKPFPGRPRMGHDRRAPHDARHPLLLTMRAAAAVPSLRSTRLFATVRDSIAAGATAGFRVVHFSVQQDHIHAIVEADSDDDLTSGIRGLTIRIALAVKRLTGLRRIWGDRYHGTRAVDTTRSPKRDRLRPAELSKAPARPAGSRPSQLRTVVRRLGAAQRSDARSPPDVYSADLARISRLAPSRSHQA